MNLFNFGETWQNASTRVGAFIRAVNLLKITFLL